MNIDVTALGRIAVLMGGVSSEREISLRSGTAILEALRGAGCAAEGFDIDTEDGSIIVSRLQRSSIDLAFIALHGRFGEDGRLQAILEKEQIPYTGSGSQASRLAFDKILSQQIFQKNALRVPQHVIADKNKDDAREILKQVTFPVFVKPACEGSSIGVSYVTEAGRLKEALDLAWRYGEGALIEKAIKGKEVTAGILDRKALPLIEIRPKSVYFDFHSKYQKGNSEYIIPADLPVDLAEEIQSVALRAFSLLGCRHMARLDFMIGEDNRYYILEINTIPGFTATSLLPKAAAAAGLNFNELCIKIAGLAHAEKKKDTGINITHSR